MPLDAKDQVLIATILDTLDAMQRRHDFAAAVKLRDAIELFQSRYLPPLSEPVGPAGRVAAD